MCLRSHTVAHPGSAAAPLELKSTQGSVQWLLLLLHVGSMHVHGVPGTLVHALASGECSQMVPAGEAGS